MSALAHGIKDKMFGFLKNWLPRPIENQPESQPLLRAASPASLTPTCNSPGLGHVAASAVTVSEVELPLASLLPHVPSELRSRVRSNVSAASVRIPMETVLPQLASGAVKITFGELRQLAPELFYSGGDRDHVPVPLPLAEVLSQIAPALLTRRPAQKQCEVPAEIPGPFGDQGQALIFSIGPSELAPATAQPALRATSPRPPTPAATSRHSITTVPPITPPTPQFAGVPVPQPFIGRPVSPHSVPARPIAFPIAAQPAPATAASNGTALLVALASLTETWPEAVCREVALMNLSKTIVALPMEFIQGRLKEGRVTCSWKQLRGWIKSAPAASEASAVSANDAAMLDLPLKVIAPLYLAKQQAVKAQKKVTVDDGIPNLFFGSAQPDTVAAPTPAQPTIPPAAPAPAPSLSRSADTNYYVWKDDADSPIEAEVVFKRGQASPGTEFLKRYATPNEIVSRAAALDGVAGALISLPDGLLVANRVSPELNPDTLAAFLPQIFGRVSQCTKELRMGDLNNLNFTVGNVPWKIFRVGSIFFAAFGRAGEPLPSVQLAGLAAELDRKPS